MKIIVVKDSYQDELPNGCADCFHRNFNWCELENRAVPNKTIVLDKTGRYRKALEKILQIKERPEWCPLIEIDLPQQPN